jgi:hypothetical protein
MYVADMEVGLCAHSAVTVPRADVASWFGQLRDVSRAAADALLAISAERDAAVADLAWLSDNITAIEHMRPVADDGEAIDARWVEIVDYYGVRHRGDDLRDAIDTARR